MLVVQTFGLLKKIIYIAVIVLVFAGLVTLYDPAIPITKLVTNNLIFLRQLMYILLGYLAFDFFSKPIHLL